MYIGAAAAVIAVGGVIYKYVALNQRNKMERTFAMIKPDAVAAGHTGAIIQLIEENGFKIVGMRKADLPKEAVELFYAVHKERPFFGELVTFITSGPVVLLALEKEDAIKAWRDLMGSTNPEEAAEGTMRKRFGTSKGKNATHGSDAPETAAFELGLFFPELTK
jgi:nucleoside-diphosphate kinase